MKRFILLIISAFFMQSAFSQIMQKGNFDIRAGVGFGVYNFNTTAYEDNQHSAVPGLFNLGIAYQISDDFSLGLDYERNGFVTDDSTDSKVVSQNIGVTASYHFINGEKNALAAFLTVGTSNLKFEDFDDSETVTARGTQVQVGLAWRHYFSDNFGFFLNTSFPYYSYNEFKNSNGDVYEDSRIVTGPGGVPIIESRTVSGVMTGINLRIGLALKFGG